MSCTTQGSVANPATAKWERCMCQENWWNPSRWAVAAFNPCWLMIRSGIVLPFIYPIGSMHAIYGNIDHQYTPNVSMYTIHGSHGYWGLFHNPSCRGIFISHCSDHFSGWAPKFGEPRVEEHICKQRATCRVFFTCNFSLQPIHWNILSSFCRYINYINHSSMDLWQFSICNLMYSFNQPYVIYVNYMLNHDLSFSSFLTAAFHEWMACWGLDYHFQTTMKWIPSIPCGLSTSKFSLITAMIRYIIIWC